MKLNYTTNNGRITAEFEASTQVGMFAEIASFQEVFEENKCGKCGSTDLKYIVRTVDDNSYYELKCNGKTKEGKFCRAKFSFGANKKGGGLFPKRKDSDGKYLPDNGWTRWNKETNQAE